METPKRICCLHLSGGWSKMVVLGDVRESSDAHREGNKRRMNAYQTPMHPWPALATYARQLHLPQTACTLHLYDAGPAGPDPLLLIHGLGDEADTWRHLIPALSAHRRVRAPDLPGYGRSDRPRRAYTVPLFQHALLELLDLLQVKRVTWAGHSLGAILAHSLALEHPERVARLVLIGGSLVSAPQRLDLGTLLFLVPGLGEWLYTRLRTDPPGRLRVPAPLLCRPGRPAGGRPRLSLPARERAGLERRAAPRFFLDLPPPGALAAGPAAGPARAAGRAADAHHGGLGGSRPDQPGGGRASPGRDAARGAVGGRARRGAQCSPGSAGGGAARDSGGWQARGVALRKAASLSPYAERLAVQNVGLVSGSGCCQLGKGKDRYLQNTLGLELFEYRLLHSFDNLGMQVTLAALAADACRYVFKEIELVFPMIHVLDRSFL